MRQFVGEQLLFWPRRFVLQEQRRIVGTIAFLRGHELAEFFRALQDGAGVRVLRGSLAGVLAQAVQVVIRFARQFVFHAPGSFKNRIRFHASSLPSVHAGARTRILAGTLGFFFRLITISTFWSRAVRNRNSRSVEKPSSRPRMRAEILG